MFVPPTRDGAEGFFFGCEVTNYVDWVEVEMSVARLGAYDANAVHLLCPGWRPSGERVVMGVELELEINRELLPDDNPTRLRLIEESSSHAYMSSCRSDSTSGTIFAKDVALNEVLGVVGEEWLIGKHDGSLACGVEFVSRPAALTTHLRKWKPMFDGMPSYLEAKKSCGLHVHVSKHSLTSEQLGLAVAFTTNRRHREWIEGLAGRSQSQYARIIQRSKSNYASTDKYEAVHTARSATAEWRLFAATTKWEEFSVRLQFVHAVVSWARTAPSDEEGGEWGRWAEWLLRESERTDLYASLVRYVKAHECVSDPVEVAPAPGTRWTRAGERTYYTVQELVDVYGCGCSRCVSIYEDRLNRNVVYG
jgi:hypothetical protein